jgi:hypothetical protein
MFRLRRFLRALQQIRLTRGEKVAYHPVSGVINEEDLRLSLTMDEQQFFASASQIRLLPHEKVAIREAIFRQSTIPWWQIRLMSMSSLVSALVIVSILSGGVTFAAESTVPGDILYPVKIHVNERLMHTMARTDDDRAIVETKRAARRLVEAEMLLKRHSFSAEKQQMLASAMDTHMYVVRSRMDTLNRENRPASLQSLSSTVDATLRDRSKSLKKMNSASAEPLLLRVRRERMNAQVMELSAVMSEEGSALPPMPHMPQAEADAGADMATAVVRMKTTAEQQPAPEEINDDMKDEMLLAAEARLTLARMQMSEMTAAVETATDQLPATATLMMMEEATAPTESDESASSTSSEVPAVNDAPPVTTFMAPEASLVPEASPQDMVRHAEEELRTGNAPEAMRAATSALEKVREMKKDGSKALRQELKRAAPDDAEEKNGSNAADEVQRRIETERKLQ